MPLLSLDSRARIRAMAAYLFDACLHVIEERRASDTTRTRQRTRLLLSSPNRRRWAVRTVQTPPRRYWDRSVLKESKNAETSHTASDWLTRFGAWSIVLSQKNRSEWYRVFIIVDRPPPSDQSGLSSTLWIIGSLSLIHLGRDPSVVISSFLSRSLSTSTRKYWGWNTFLLWDLWSPHWTLRQIKPNRIKLNRILQSEATSYVVGKTTRREWINQWPPDCTRTRFV